MIKVTCLGAAGSVTGSNYLIETGRGKQIIVDCGLFQGGRQMEARNWLPWDFNPREVDAVLLTHAHLDHSGRLPKLVRDGFRGQIIASPPTVDLCKIMLLDSAHIQEMEAEWQNRKNRRQQHKQIVPLYTTEDAQECIDYLHAQETDHTFDVCPGVEARLKNAGHILGSCILELMIDDEDGKAKLVFSGDIGRNHQLIVQDPQPVKQADMVFIESTYGNRLHRSFEASKDELLEAINYATHNGEKVVIPAFAVERTQELLYMLGEFEREGKLPNIPVFLDSPLAIKATEIFRNNRKYYDDETMEIVKHGFDPFSLKNLRFTPTVEESMQINEYTGAAIIIAGSGMCNAGRIKHHLKHNLWKEGASIVFVGYQAAGTTGRQILEGHKWVKLFWQDVAVKAKVFSIGGFSAHADQEGLIEWLSHFEKPQPQVCVVHGEPATSLAFAETLRARYSGQVHVPRWKEVIKLTAHGITSEVTPEIEATSFREHAHASLREVELELERVRSELERALHEDRLSDKEVERLATIRDELKTIIPG